MKKLYYTDPFKAAWMAREFGVKFSSQYFCNNLKSPKEWMLEDGVIVFSLDNVNEAISCKFFSMFEGWGTKSKLYIHPDSLHIFRMRNGDIIQSEDDVSKIHIHPETRALFKWHTDVNWCPLNPEIIQRDNKAFFTPEVEA